MIIKAFELMKLVKDSPEDYEDKRYRVVKGIMVNDMGKSFSECIVSTEGFYITDNKDKTKYAYQQLYVSGSTELEEIKEPVDIFTALKAYREGKKVECVVKDRVEKYGYNSNVIDKDITMICLDEILQGKWYIED